MTKTELIGTVAEEAGITKKDSGLIMDTLFQVIANTLASGEKVQINGFGCFDVVERAARVGRNPQTNKEIMIPSCKAPKFKPGSVLKEQVNN